MYCTVPTTVPAVDAPGHVNLAGDPRTLPLNQPSQRVVHFLRNLVPHRRSLVRLGKPSAIRETFLVVGADNLCAVAVGPNPPWVNSCNADIFPSNRTRPHFAVR